MDGFGGTMTGWMQDRGGVLNDSGSLAWETGWMVQAID